MDHEIFIHENNGHAHHMWAFLMNMNILVQNSWISSKHKNFTQKHLGVYSIVIEMYGQRHPYIGSTIVLSNY